ncbi:MAG: extracellular solute-binding protein [Clostridia bacterium]|nr:extracellular solute-binding protein [Clostridia bacterium]
MSSKQMEETMKKVITLTLVIALMASLLTGCLSTGATTATPAATTAAGETSAAQTAGETVEIEFFQYKREAQSTFDALIAKFQEANPTIQITQNAPADAGTVIKTRVASGDVPTIIAVGADNLYTDLAKAGTYVDLTNSPELANVQSAYVDTIKMVSGLDQVYAIPYAANADAVIYNKKIFADNGVEIPKTWDEFIAAAETFKKAGITPFYFTFGESWTTLPAFNVIAANAAPADFFQKVNAGETTFSEGWAESMTLFKQLLAYGHDDNMGKAYADGNTAFANGESAMYLQGVWAITDILKANPEIDLGIFPYPVGNPAKVVSGVDLLFSVSAKATPAQQDAAMKWINFLMEQGNATQYISEQKCFSAVKGVSQEEPTLAGVKEAFAAGNVVDFPDHYVPSSMTLDKLLQEFVLDQDEAATLEKMDQAWNEYKGRQ